MVGRHAPSNPTQGKPTREGKQVRIDVWEKRACLRTGLLSNRVGNGRGTASEANPAAACCAPVDTAGREDTLELSSEWAELVLRLFCSRGAELSGLRRRREGLGWTSGTSTSQPDWLRGSSDRHDSDLGTTGGWGPPSSSPSGDLHRHWRQLPVVPFEKTLLT